MRHPTKLSVLAAVLLAALVATGCQQLRARDQLNKGVRSYRSARYQEAIEHFKRATELDPSLLNARIYLATAYANQFMPGVDSEENMRNGEQAIVEYKRVLEVDPQNVNSVAGIANIYLNMKEMEKAKEWYQKQIQINPSDPQPYYSVGVINWTQTYQPRMEVKAALGIGPDEPIKDREVREDLCENNMPLIEEAFTMLNKAVELRPDYDDAMAYINLTYREQADCQASEEARTEDLKKADEWIQKTLEVKKQRAEKTSTGLQ